MISRCPRKMALLIAANAIHEVREAARWPLEYHVRPQLGVRVAVELRRIERDLWRDLEKRDPQR